MNSLTSINPSLFAASATTPVYDGTQGMGDLMNDFWTFFNKINKGAAPDDAQFEGLLTNVNDFLAYIQAHGGVPSSTTDPNTYQLYLAITKIPIGPDSAGARAGWTLQQYAADFAANPATTSYRDLESGIGYKNLMTFVVNTELGSNDWYQGYGNPKIQQNGNAQFLSDMQTLYNYIKTFDQSPNQPMAQYVILPAIQKIVADMSSLPGGKVTDGYLKVFEDFLKGTGLEKATATNIYALLTSTGGSSTTLAQDLANTMNQAGIEEYNGTSGSAGKWNS